ncbi:hypothetical protein BDY21DRAFT_81485 [Lineolata rhizophorae]|uniref:RRM domain-containing protein n=1 Tax=Lineolata rhizophorae TaxID=578093 RepID=A0A6A6PBW3_9PEZI|nr:hypothetical protein BDY21DRAFT_81485 [Lineolata rhizophorae]
MASRLSTGFLWCGAAHTRPLQACSYDSRSSCVCGPIFLACVSLEGTTTKVAPVPFTIRKFISSMTTLPGDAGHASDWILRYVLPINSHSLTVHILLTLSRPSTSRTPRHFSLSFFASKVFLSSLANSTIGLAAVQVESTLYRNSSSTMNPNPTGSRRGSEQEASYILTVEGLPQGLTWQEFKDHVRKKIHFQPGWTTVDKHQSGKVFGTTVLKTEEDAEIAYDYLCGTPIKGNRLYVHFAVGSIQCQALRKCNCFESGRVSCPWTPIPQSPLAQASAGPGAASPTQSPPMASFAPQYHGFSPNPAVPPLALAGAIPPLAQLPPQQFAGHMAAPGAQYPYLPNPGAAYAPLHPGQRITPGVVQPRDVAGPSGSAPPQAEYRLNAKGIPINTSMGTVRIAQNVVHMSNMKYTVEASDLRELFRTFGLSPRDIKLTKKSPEKKQKPSASASFDSDQEAQQAVQRLNDLEFQGLQLRVRIDNDARQRSIPTIADGANYGQGT